VNKSESKYFNTAEKMDKAFLELLERKDFEFITVKEICAKAGVNRSTFYLHYETISDLLEESTEYFIRRFLTYMNHEPAGFIAKIKSCPLDELYLVTSEYLSPYLNYIIENKRLFKTAIENARTFRLDKAYGQMFCHVFSPILERFNVPSEYRSYMMTFYIRGIMSIITEWLKNDCRDSVESIIAAIKYCVPKM